MNESDYGAIRVSYSILDAWARGDIASATAPYTGIEPEIDEETRKALDFGKKKHAEWERIVRRTGALPKVFGGQKLNSPKLELSTKKVRELTPWCVLSGVLDVLDGTIAIDYKTGRSSASQYVESHQHEVYQILYPQITKFVYCCDNQHLSKRDPGRTTVGVVHLSKRTLQDGLEWVLKNAKELRIYLIDKGYGARLDQGKGLK